MAKPIFVIKVDRSILFNPSQMESFKEMFERICHSIGDEYHVLAIEKQYDVEVLGIENVEITYEELQDLMENIVKDKEEK